MPPSFDYETIDPSKIDPSKINFGTCLQDCSLIAQIYERGAHSTPTETAVFVTMSRILENNRGFASNAAETLGSYLRQPAQPNTDTSNGITTNTQNSFQGLVVENTDISTLGESFGKSLMDWMKDCIPCQARLIALLELHPNIDLLGALEADLKAKLAMLMDLANVFNNIDIYGDFCSLLGLLNFMCIPDLQKLIALFSSLLANQALELDGFIGLLQGLIAPLFSPILMSITSLLDQFAAIILSPLQCIIDSINEQLRKLNYQVDGTKALEPLKSGLMELKNQIIEGERYIKNKLNFYIEQIKTLLGEVGAGDTAYLKAMLRKLMLVRLIAFIVAIITALSKGQSVCSPGKPPETSELDNFFNNFLNPNSSFNLWIDSNGEIQITDKNPDFPDTLPDGSSVLKYEGDDVIIANPDLEIQISTVQKALTQQVFIKTPCRFDTTVNEAEKVNQWISEMNNL